MRSAWLFTNENCKVVASASHTIPSTELTRSLNRCCVATASATASCKRLLLRSSSVVRSRTRVSSSSRALLSASSLRRRAALMTANNAANKLKMSTRGVSATSIVNASKGGVK